MEKGRFMTEEDFENFGKALETSVEESGKITVARIGDHFEIRFYFKWPEYDDVQMFIPTSHMSTTGNRESCQVYRINVGKYEGRVNRKMPWLVGVIND